MQLKAAIQRAKTHPGGSRESLHLLQETIARPDVLPSRISLHTAERIVVAEIEHIVRCEADGNNTRFFLASGEKIFVTKTLKQFDQILERHHFVRVHQSHLVNVRYVREFLKKDGGYLLLKNNDQIPVSGRKKVEVLEILERM